MRSSGSWETGDEVELSDSPEDFYGNWEPDPSLVPDDPDDPTIDANWEPDEDTYRNR